MKLSKQNLAFLGILLFAFTGMQAVKAQTQPKAEDLYVTTEDIVSDLVFPAIDKAVVKEYGGDPLFDWQWNKIVAINYNDDHSYDIAVRIQIPPKKLDNPKEDLVRVRISPSCDSGKINMEKCNHGFKIEILEYKHLSQ